MRVGGRKEGLDTRAAECKRLLYVEHVVPQKRQIISAMLVRNSGSASSQQTLCILNFMYPERTRKAPYLVALVTFGGAALVRPIDRLSNKMSRDIMKDKL